MPGDPRGIGRGIRRCPERSIWREDAPDSHRGSGGLRGEHEADTTTGRDHLSLTQTAAILR